MGKTEFYSYIFLKELNKGERVSLSEISRKYSIPLSFLYKLGIKLKNSGLVESKEGVDGGYKLCVSDISLYDIIHTFNAKDMGFCDCRDRSCSKRYICKSYINMQKNLDKKLKELKI